MITQARINAQSATVLLARVLLESGQPATQADISSISATVTDRTTETLVGTPAVSVSESVYDTLQTDSRWPQDGGYNLAAELSGDNFPAGGTTYRICLTVFPQGADSFTLLWDLQTDALT